MTAEEIYTHFKINQGLRQHMIRVAAVAQTVGEALGAQIDTGAVVKAALVHDLGNIVKFTFNLGSEGFAPEGPEYYKAVQAEVIKKYGNNDHEVTLQMMREIGISDQVISIAEATSLVGSVEVAQTGSIEEKVMQYADMRVQINGIVSLVERYAELAARTVPHRYSAETMESSKQALLQIESDLFVDAALSPSEITEDTTSDLQVRLGKYQVV